MNDARWVLYKVWQDAVAVAIGDDDTDARLCHRESRLELRRHASASSAAFAGEYVVADVVARLYAAYDFAAWLRGIAVVEAIDTSQQDKRLCPYHLGDEAREFVVVREHQFLDADRVVLVDDGQHAVLQHHLHAGFLVLAGALAQEVILGGQHLADVYVVLAEEVVIEIDELDLPHGREELTLFYGVEHVVDLQFLPATSHGSARDEHHVIAPSSQPRDLVHQRRHASDVELASVCREHVAAHLHYDSPFHLFSFLPFLFFTFSLFHFSPAFRQRMTAELKAAWSSSFSPLMVMPPGVVTLSMAASGCP